MYPRIYPRSKANCPGSQRIRGDVGRGKQLIARHRCGQCHELPEVLKADERPANSLSADSNWQGGCLGSASSEHALPGFGLTSNQIGLKELLLCTSACFNEQR